MIRVLQVVGTMDLGGAETLIMNLYRSMDREKIQFDFLCHNRIEAKYTDEIRQMGGKLYMVEGISHVGPIRYQKNLYKFFKEHPEYQTVHSHHDLLSGVILNQAKKAGVKNRYSHSHSTYDTKTLSGALQKRVFQSFFSRSVTHAFACGDAAGKALYRGRLKRSFEVLPNGISAQNFAYDSESRERFRRELQIEDQPVIGHVGRFVSQKNHVFLIQIFAEMVKRKENIHLALVGEGALQPQIKEQVQKLGLADRVHFLGSRRDIPDILCGMDLFLFPSLCEGLSVAMVEAQTAGVPILTSTSVSSEAALTDLVKQLPLQQSAEEWARIALEMIEAGKNADRSVYAAQIREAGFDIGATAQRLQEFYIHNQG